MLATVERRLGVAINIPYLEHSYFFIDKPVPYAIGDQTIYIKPIELIDSEIFMSSIDLFMIDKNSSPSVEIIQMSYLDFVLKILLPSDDSNRIKLTNILYLSLGFEAPVIKQDENGKLLIYDVKADVSINSKQFEEIRRIILYQNIPHFDDSYVNPEIKEVMAEMDSIKNKDVEIPSLERKIGIITAHCGLPKREQMLMTYRSHTILFEEVCGEVEFTTTRPIALYAGKDKELDHWVYKKKKNKFDGYFTSEDKYSRSMGGDGKVKTSSSTASDILQQQFSSFTK